MSFITGEDETVVIIFLQVGTKAASGGPEETSEHVRVHTTGLKNQIESIVSIIVSCLNCIALVKCYLMHFVTSQ